MADRDLIRRVAELERRLEELQRPAFQPAPDPTYQPCGICGFVQIGEYAHICGNLFPAVQEPRFGSNQTITPDWMKNVTVWNG